MRAEALFVSIVVPTYNRRTSLQRLLRALGEQAVAATRFEVVIVDDGSTDGTIETVRAMALPYDCLVIEQAHQGPAAARNLGVARAHGRLVLFLDDDVVPHAGLLARHVAAHLAHQHAVVIGPMRPPRDWVRPAWVRWEEDLLQIQYRELVAGKYPCTPRQFYTANASLPRDLFLRAGGFDPSFRRAEDVEFAFRLRDLGARFIFEPQAEVMHYASRSFAAWSQTPYQYGRYDVLMERQKGHETLACAAVEFHQRHPFTRTLVHLCLGRPRLSHQVVPLLGAGARLAEGLRCRPVANAILSGAFNLRYWQGVSDELGGAGQVWRLIAAAAGRPAPDVTLPRSTHTAGVTGG